MPQTRCQINTGAISKLMVDYDNIAGAHRDIQGLGTRAAGDDFNAPRSELLLHDVAVDWLTVGDDDAINPLRHRGEGRVVAFGHLQCQMNAKT